MYLVCRVVEGFHRQRQRGYASGAQRGGGSERDVQGDEGGTLYVGRRSVHKRKRRGYSGSPQGGEGQPQVVAVEMGLFVNNVVWVRF